MSIVVREQGRDFVAVNEDPWQVDGNSLSLSYRQLIRLREAIDFQLSFSTPVEGELEKEDG
jgi:hypothetical protein